MRVLNGTDNMKIMLTCSLFSNCVYGPINWQLIPSGLRIQASPQKTELFHRSYADN